MEECLEAKDAVTLLFFKTGVRKVMRFHVAIL